MILILVRTTTTLKLCPSDQDDRWYTYIQSKAKHIQGYQTPRKRKKKKKAKPISPSYTFPVCSQKRTFSASQHTYSAVYSRSVSLVCRLYLRPPPLISPFIHLPFPSTPIPHPPIPPVPPVPVPHMPPPIILPAKPLPRPHPSSSHLRIFTAHHGAVILLGRLMHGVDVPV